MEHRQSPATRGLAPVRKTIYSLNDLREILFGCNRRYLEYLSSLDDFSAGIRALDRLTQPRPVNGRNLRGLNFFSRAEQTLLSALQRPGFNVAGLRRADLLGPKFSAKERKQLNLSRFYAIAQIEYCRNFIFKRNFPIHKLFERSCELGLWRLTADKITE